MFEATLCEDCFRDEGLRLGAIQRAALDAECRDPLTFQDSTGNDALACWACGRQED